jgi:hypothetical protein
MFGRSDLTPLSPLQPETLGTTQIILAGEGSIRERGRSPLSNSFPLSNIIKIEHWRYSCLRGGLRG